MFKFFFIKPFALFVAAFVSLFVVGDKAPAYDVGSPNECLMNFTVLSDVHIEGNNFDRLKQYSTILKNVKSNKSGNDALVFLGDNTECAQEIESILFYGLTKLYSPSKTILTAVGNHDVGHGGESYDECFNSFRDYSNEFFNLGMDKPYYYKVINGCYFIFIGIEKGFDGDKGDEFFITEEQFNWLEKTVNEAEKTGKPIFVFTHSPINRGIEMSDRSYDTVGRLREILAYRDNLYVFHGHYHQPFEGWSFHREFGVQQINLPSLLYDSETVGDGMVVEVYKDKVVMRARNFCNGQWLDGYQETFPLIAD